MKKENKENIVKKESQSFINEQKVYTEFESIDYQKPNYFELEVRQNKFLLTYGNVIKNQITKERIIQTLINNWKKNIQEILNKNKNINTRSEISDDELKDFLKDNPNYQQNIDQIGNNQNEELTYYVVQEKYKQTEEQHIHILVFYPNRIKLKTTKRIEKIFGIFNTQGEITVVNQNNYTYKLRYLMKEDIHPLFNFQATFLLSVLQNSLKIDLEVKQKLLKTFYSDLNKENKENKEKDFNKELKEKDFNKENREEKEEVKEYKEEKELKKEQTIEFLKTQLIQLTQQLNQLEQEEQEKILKNKRF